MGSEQEVVRSEVVVVLADQFDDQVRHSIAVDVAFDEPGARAGVLIGAQLAGGVGERAAAEERERIVGGGRAVGIDAGQVE